VTRAPVVTDDDVLAAAVRSLREHGQRAIRFGTSS
jgi:hypothetical protein